MLASYNSLFIQSTDGQRNSRDVKHHQFRHCVLTNWSKLMRLVDTELDHDLHGEGQGHERGIRHCKLTSKRS